ncbi:protein roadkill-like [Plodia interpunctella]|uniref:protein roadkill-like n=1 Tax=Plodia interpunctella TaxID=58824 RepID=UPI00236793FF|nr:protein roadkill-like [Plodia interpunctella]
MSEVKCIKYDIIKEDIDTTLHKLLWDIQFDLISVPRELRSFARHNDVPVFQMKVEIFEEDDIIVNISYMYPCERYIKSILSMAERNEYYVISTSGYNMIQANEWHHLMTLKSDHIQVETTGMGQYLLMNFEFKFKVINNIRFKYESPNLKTRYNFQTFFITSLFSDVVLISNDGKEFKVHKIMLASQSDVFCAHISHDTCEAITNTIKSPFDAEVLEAVLSYIYGDKVVGIHKTTEQILIAADFYHIDGLKSLCEQELCQRINIENAVTLLELADAHNAVKLKNDALNFIKDNRADMIIKTTAWAELKSVHIVKLLFEAVKCGKECNVIYYECEFGTFFVA